MDPNPHVSTQTREQLFTEMKLYHDDRGTYAVEMLMTALLLLEHPERYPRPAEAAAACIRQAVVEVFGDTKDHRESMKYVVKRIVTIKESILATGAKDTKALQNLSTEVDGLRDRVCRPTLEARIKEIFRNSSGIDPIDGPHSLVREYRDIVKKSNDLLHHISKTRIDPSEVHTHYEGVIDMLTMIFLPTERLDRIERLATLPTPQKSDLNELRRIVKNVYGFDHFARMMISPTWFDMMEPGMLQSDTTPWPLCSLVWYLKDDHVDAFIHMLKKNFDRWVSNHIGLGELGMVCLKLGDRGLPYMTKTLRRSNRVRLKRDQEIGKNVDSRSPNHTKEIEHIGSSIRLLDSCARRAFLGIKQPNHDFVELAEHLLSPTSTVDYHYQTNDIPAKLVDGMNRESATRIVGILALKLQHEYRSWNLIPSLDSITKSDHSYGVEGLAANLCRALAKAGELGVPTSQLVTMLPDVVRHRFEAWLYGRVDDVPTSTMVGFMVDGCNTRPPSDEDRLLLDRLKRDGHLPDLAKLVVKLLGKAPDVTKMMGRLFQQDIQRDDFRRLLWAHTLRPFVELPDEWKRCLDVMDTRLAVDAQTPQARGTNDGDDPLEVDPLEAVRDLQTSQYAGGFPGLADEHSPASHLENMVRNDVSKWAEDPVGVIRELRHPTYAIGYFRGLAGVVDDIAPYVDGVISAVKFAHTRQWDGGISASSTFPHADELVSVEAAGVGLIEKIIKSGISIGEDAMADVWLVVSDGVVLPATTTPPDYSLKYLHTVPDQPHVKATHTLLEVIRYAKRHNITVPDAILTRLTKTLYLTGRYGVDYHACLGARQAFLRCVEYDWFLQNQQYLFGSATSDELGEVALDACLVWGSPDQFILEEYADGVLAAVKRNIPHATYYLLNSLLCGFNGYDPEHIAKKLTNVKPEDVSRMWWEMSKLLPEGSGADRVQRGIAFWNNMLKYKPEALVGCGWWADVPGIHQERWEELMLRTCGMVKNLEWSQRVAERISKSPTITDTGWQILARLLHIGLRREREKVTEHAMGALRKTTGMEYPPKSRSHLRNTLTERGISEAAKL